MDTKIQAKIFKENMEKYLKNSRAATWKIKYDLLAPHEVTREGGIRSTLRP